MFLKPSSSYLDNDLEDNLDNEVYLGYEDILEDKDNLKEEHNLDNEDCIEEEGYFEDENCLCKDVCPLISCSRAMLAQEDIITLCFSSFYCMSMPPSFFFFFFFLTFFAP